MVAEDADPVLVEKAPEQILGRQRRIGQLGAADARHEGQRPAPAVLGSLRLLAFLRGRQALQHESADAPMPLVLGGAQLERALELLRLAEVVMDALREGGAGQLDDALIALGEIALVDGEGEIARPQEPRHRGLRALRQALGVELRIAAQRAGAAHIGDHQAHGAVAGGLQGEDALVFQRVREQRRQAQHLGEQSGHRRRVGMAVQDLVGERPQPRQAAFQARRLDLEGQDQVVGDRHGRRAVSW